VRKVFAEGVWGRGFFQKAPPPKPNPPYTFIKLHKKGGVVVVKYAENAK